MFLTAVGNQMDVQVTKKVTIYILSSLYERLKLFEARFPVIFRWDGAV